MAFLNFHKLGFLALALLVAITLVSASQDGGDAKSPTSIHHVGPPQPSLHYSPITVDIAAQQTAHVKRDVDAKLVMDVQKRDDEPTCITTFWQFPTPYQHGTQSTVWTATTVVTDYFNCSGCVMSITHISKSHTHFTETTTISSVLSLITPACLPSPTGPNDSIFPITTHTKPIRNQLNLPASSTPTPARSFTYSTLATSTSTRTHHTYNCTTTFYVLPTPDFPGPTKWVFPSTSTATEVFDCKGCRLFVKTVPGSPSQTFTTTVTSSSVLGIVTQACASSKSATV